MVQNLANAKFDLAGLREITDGDPAIESELCFLFWQTAQECIKKLNALVQEDSQSSWPKVIHELKGAAANIHAVELAQLCQQAELNGKSLDERKIHAQKITQALESLKPLMAGLSPR